MMAGCVESAAILSQEEIASGIYSLKIKTESIAKSALAGQFVNLYCRDGARLLPRPLSVCEADGESGVLRLVYRVVGMGTAEFSGYAAGESIRVAGPFGNGFPVDDIAGKRVMIIGGGIGIPPMVELSRVLREKSGKEKTVIVAGYRREMFLNGELSANGMLFVATEDGSAGTKGTVIDAIEGNDLTADVICACGPLPMLKAVAALAKDWGVPAWISLEERMGCGIGACLSCVCETNEKNPHTNVNNARVCADGPVFAADRVKI